MRTIAASLLSVISIAYTTLPVRAQYGLSEAATKAGIPTDRGSLPEVIGQVIGLVLSMAGVAFLVLMVYAGFVWMLARGEAGEVKRAREMMIAAVIGMIIVVGSYALTNFVFTSLVGAGN